MNLSAPDLLGHLRDARYADLETSLGPLQRQFERGEAGETELKRAFGVFQKPDPALSERFNGWMEAHPGSYVAHAALAEWLLARAWAYRGQQTANLVSDQGWRGLHHHLEQAEGCARHATTLSANPLTAWLVVAYVHNTRGCGLSLEDVQEGRYPDWFQRPLEDNPRSLEVRLAMLYHLRAEWGGSEEHMLAFVRGQQDSGLLGPGDMQRLWAEFHACAAHHAQFFLNDADKAVERARLAADLRELKAAQLFVALTHAKKPPAERRAALERFLTAAEQDPAATLPGNLLWALLQSKDWLEALLPRVTALLTRWAEAGDHEAAVALGYLRLLNNPWTLPDPTPLLTRARDEGDRQAAEMLVRLQEGNLGAALRDTPAKREAMLAAADLGSPEMSWRVYQGFDAFRKQFGLDDRAKYRYLLKAADAGNNDARFALAQQLRAGLVEVGDDGVLRPVDTPPLQESLDYAKHLLERAAAEDHKGAHKALKAAKAGDWDAKTARRVRAPSVEHEREAARGGRPWWQWWLIGSLIVGVLRACATFASDDSPAVPQGLTSPALGAEAEATLADPGSSR
ncbi:DUF4034 domain-containing protein [Deinococcus aestuarii]|uniref:DUF4034 domain-containing protein n=1 Tax=Deinococcus aestuarii TaxID=2774531 RepID=UPI001C0C7E12|nr:DUF4034 domain-containing protein [Deinococcus aestuarii]